MAEQTSDIGEQLATIERKPAKERAPEYSRLQATVGKELGAAETGLKKAEIDVGIAQKEAGTKALREQIGLEEKELEAGRERVSRYELPTFTPSQETLTDYARLGSMVMTLGLMLGKGAKDSGLTALNAMSGLLQGWKQGRKDVYERELKKFDKEFQRIKEIRNSIEKDIQRAIQLWPTKRQEAIAAAESAAYKAGSGSIIEYYAKTGQLKKAQELIASSKKTTDEIVKQQARIDEIKAREEAANRRQIAAFSHAEKLQKERLEAEDKRFTRKIGTAGSRATIYERTGKLVPTDKEAESIGMVADAVGEVSNLRKKLTDPEIQTGTIASFAPIIQRIQSVTQPLDEAQFKNLVDRELTGNDKTTLFLKDALLASFKIEQGLVGSRVPVATQRAVGPILDPRAYKRETFDRLLEEREDLLYRSAQRRGFNRKDINSLFEGQYETGEPIAPSPSKNLPNVGEVIDGYRFKGGNPANKSNWEMVQ